MTSVRAALGGILLPAVLAACATLPRIAPHAPPATFARAPSALRQGQSTDQVIGVLDAGWHTGLIVPASALGPLDSLARAALGHRALRHGALGHGALGHGALGHGVLRHGVLRHGVLGLGAPGHGAVGRGAARIGYLSFGWGNRRFYISDHPTSGDGLRALFESESVLLVQAAPSAAVLADEGTVSWLCASRSEIWRLDLYLNAALQRRDGAPVKLGPGPEPGSRFFASGEHYDLLHTCNTWTLAGLEYAGFRVHAFGALFASQVESHIRDLPHCARVGT